MRQSISWVEPLLIPSDKLLQTRSCSLAKRIYLVQIASIVKPLLREVESIRPLRIAVAHHSAQLVRQLALKRFDTGGFANANRNTIVIKKYPMQTLLKIVS